MKAIFAICLVLAFVCAQSTFTPEWTSCRQPDSYWLTKNVTLDAAPVAGKNSTFTFCGTNVDWWRVHVAYVNVTSGTDLNMIIPLDNVYVARYATACYDVSIQIPEGQKDLAIHFSSGFLEKEFGCEDVTLHLESNNKKFLPFF